MAKNTRSMYFDLFGRDKSLGKTMKTSGKQAESLGHKFRKSGLAMAAGFGIAAIGAERLARNVTGFLKDSVANAADAEASQLKLATAFKKFDIKANITQLRTYNSLLEMKVGIDDDELASGQAVLAQFGLTGKQIKTITPLLADYVIKTGKDAPAAAKDLGRAILGQGRALKALGINFTDLKDPTKNFDELVKGLNDKIGGTAIRSTETYTGQLRLLKVGFGEVKESIGRAFLPSLVSLAKFANGTLVPALQRVADWAGPRIALRLGKITDVLKGFKGMSFGQIAQQLAKLSPVFAVFLTIATGLKPVLPALGKALGEIAPKLVPLIAPLAQLAIKLLPLFTQIIIAILPILPPLIGLIGGLVSALAPLVAVTAGALAAFGPLNKMLASDSPDAFGKFLVAAQKTGKPFTDFVTTVINTIFSLVNGLIDGLNAALSGALSFINGIRKGLGMGAISIPLLNHVGGTITIGGSGKLKEKGHKGGHSVAMAEGGIAKPRSGGTYANIAEAGVPEAVIPLSARSLAKYGLGGGGHTTVVVNVPGGFVGDENKLSNELSRIVQRAMRRGAIPKNAFVG